MDASRRIRRREIGYPERFLKEDPRIVSDDGTGDLAQALSGNGVSLPTLN
jgi:hypothetical protein